LAGGTLTRPDPASQYVWEIIQDLVATQGALYLKVDPGGSSIDLHALSAYQAGDTGEGSAGNFASDNTIGSCVMISGQELGRGSLKITHRGQADGSDASASVLALDCGSTPGTAAQVIAFVATTPTTGNLLLLRNHDAANIDDFVVKANGKTGAGITEGATPFGMVDVRPVDASTRGYFAKAYPASAAKLIELQDENGVMVFGVAQAETSIQFMSRPTPNDQGYIGWYPTHPATVVNNSALTAGQIILIRVVATKTGTVNNIDFGLSNSPAGLTNTFVGLYDTSGTRLGVSADASASWNGAAIGRIRTALTSGVSVVLGTAYYVAVLVGAGTTLPNLLRGVQNNVHNGALGTGAQNVMQSGSGQTALPSSITMASTVANNNAFWSGVAA
jgi:hypothetical protein